MLKSSLLRAACLSLLAAGAALPGHAESFASSASSAGSASSASISDSIGNSSGSSSRDKQVKQGQYRVMEVAQAPDRAETVRLTLRATEPGPVREFVLYLPRQAMDRRPLDAGQLVQVSERPYGFEFAHADNRQAFFLVLNDDWHRELDSHVVAL